MYYEYKAFVLQPNIKTKNDNQNRNKQKQNNKKYEN